MITLTLDQNASPTQKAAAKQEYYSCTFSIMLEIVPTREGHHCCTPLVIAVSEGLDSIRDSIRDIFSIEDQISLNVVWEEGRMRFATVKEDRRLVKENTPAILRLLQQRGGMDKLVAKEVVEV